jgi:hypothetical protein
MKYQINDTIIDKDGNTRKILGIVRDYYILTYDNSDEVCKELLTLLELDFYGFTLQEPKWTPEINELYYYVDIEPLCVYEEYWSEQKEDKNRLSLNPIFPHTPEGKKQAEARLLEVVAFLKK